MFCVIQSHSLACNIGLWKNRPYAVHFCHSKTMLFLEQTVKTYTLHFVVTICVKRSQPIWDSCIRVNMGCALVSVSGPLIQVPTKKQVTFYRAISGSPFRLLSKISHIHLSIEAQCDHHTEAVRKKGGISLGKGIP